MLTYYPFRYDILKRTNLLQEDIDTKKIVIDGKVDSLVLTNHFRKVNKLSFRITTIYGKMGVVIFNRAFLLNNLKLGTNIVVIGKYDKQNNILTASDILFKKLGKKEEDWLAVKSAPETVRENQSTEILFIEQCYKFLKAGGYLAIVIPDGILTNSSLQYVRDHIEETFRIVAVVSLPQTAFAANGAGVKSSVLFLKKYTKNETQQIRDLKQNSKHSLLSSYQYKEKVKQLEGEKKQAISALEKQYKEKHPSLDKKGLAPLMAEEKKEIQEEFSEKVNNLKEELQDAFLTEKQKKLKDYPIFMAIAEEIGYDATGKKIAVNELDVIGEELERFINAINNEEI